MSGRAPYVVAAIGVVLLLYWGAPFFVPLFLALLISTALSPVVNGWAYSRASATADMESPFA